MNKEKELYRIRNEFKDLEIGQENINILLNSKDFEFEKIYKVLKQDYSLSNNDDKEILKNFLIEYKKKYELQMKEAKKLMDLSYSKYKMNKAYSKIDTDSNIIKQKSKLDFSSIDFKLIFNQDKKIDPKKFEIKFLIAQKIFDKILDNKNKRQNGGFDEPKFLKNNVNKKKITNFNPITPTVKTEYTNQILKEKGNKEIIEDTISYFAGSNTSVDKLITYFPYLIQIVSGFTGENTDYKILNDDSYIYTFSKNYIEKTNFSNKSSKKPHNPPSEEGIKEILAGGKKKSSSRPQSNNKNPKSKQEFNFIKAENDLKILNKYTDIKISENKFNEFKEELYKDFFGADFINNLNTEINGGNDIRNPFMPVIKLDKSYIKNYILKQDKRIENTLIEQFKKFVNKERGEGFYDRQLSKENYSELLNKFFKEKELDNKYKDIIYKELMKKFSKEKKKQKKQKGGFEYKFQDYFNKLNIFEILNLYNKVYEYSDDGNIKNFKHNLRVLTFYLKLELCKYYICISQYIILQAQKSINNINYILKDDFNITNQNTTKMSKNANQNANKNASKKENKKENKMNKNKEEIYKQIDLFFNKKLSNVNKSSFKYETIKDDRNKLKRKIKNKNDEEALQIAISYIKSY